jgi:hexosaminidase
LKKHGKTMMRGDELSEIPKENVVQTSRHVMESIQRGSWGIFSSGFSLDQMQPASLYYAAEEIDSSLQRLTHEERSRILGGEACLSSEFVTAENIDSRIWPRTAAIAERLWSRFPTDNIEDLYRRLTVTSSRLELLAGVTHRRGYIQMLGRLARTSSLEQLKYLADVVEPVSVDERRRLRDSTGTIPLNRLVDTALPESEEARVFARLVKELQQRTIELDGRTLLTDMLAKWKGVHSRLDQILLNNYLLDDIGSLSRDLSDVAVIALKLIEVFETDGKLSEGQVKLFGTVLERAQHGKAGVRLAIVPPIHEMFKVLTR